MISTFISGGGGLLLNCLYTKLLICICFLFNYYVPVCLMFCLHTISNSWGHEACTHVQCINEDTVFVEQRAFFFTLLEDSEENKIMCNIHSSHNITVLQ